MHLKRKNIYIWLIALLHALSTSSAAQETPESWFADGRAVVERNKSYRYVNSEVPHAKNVILFIGDGMGVSTVTAARILAGQLEGSPGEENELFFETFPNIALSKTYNTDAQVPDSAGTMTAMTTGIKTDRGIINVNQYVERGDCNTVSGNELQTFLERAELKGMSTGVVTTARLTHATPAGNYAHTMERNYEDDRDAESLRVVGNCPDIARQLIEFFSNVPGSDGIEVALGGGRRSFIPRVDGADPENGGQGERLDGRDLTQEWLDTHDNSAYVWNKEQFDAIDPQNVNHLLGLFNPSHMQYAFDTPNDPGGEPSLSEMTAKAIELLSQNDEGYYLNVEAGRIDHAHHAVNPFRALNDTIELANAVKTATEMVDLNDTLIIVTADHSHVFTIAGYPKRGNPILGKVVGLDNAGNPRDEPSIARDGMPYTTLGYANGRGHAELPNRNTADAIYTVPIQENRRNDLSDVDTTHEGFHSESLIPLSDETHGGEDVAIYAIGPGSDLIRGVMEQNVIFHVMMEASQMDSR
ncbi:MAG: alkaline phosphatase [Gammaproteobacteria bacterium]|nr:alkaline phosphatase [Gammaproteobacteria bacterium]